MCGNENDAEDITQESFMKAYTFLDSYNPQYAFSTWLYTIARRLCMDFLKKKFRERDTISAMQKDQEEYTESKERRDIIQSMWSEAAKLSVDYYELLVLAYAEDKSINEIAYITKKTHSNVKTKLHRARKALAQRMKNIEYMRGDNT